MSTLPLVLKLPRHEHDKEEPDYVLVHVSSAGRHPLDLTLIGTENAAVFSLELKQSQTAALKAKNAPYNNDEWEEILLAVLCGTAGNGDHTKDVEAIAKVNTKTMAITIQKRIEGITQKLGTLTLPTTTSIEVDLYEWLGLTISSRDRTKQDLSSLQTTLAFKDAQIKTLDDSLAELVQLKTEHETSLLEKFSLLLNEKKLKIRNQQRLLAAANVDPTKLQDVKETRTAHSAGPSRPGKRKAGKSKDAEVSDSDSGFEKMDVDPRPDDGDEAVDDSDQEAPQTPEDSTADEATSDEASPPIPPPNKKTTKSAVAKGKMKSVLPTAGKEVVDDDKPPPKRELPFAKKKEEKEKAPEKADWEAELEGGEETESDDEL